MYSDSPIICLRGSAMNDYDSDEVSIAQLIGMVFNHFWLIVLICILATCLGIGVAFLFLSSPSCTLYMTVEYDLLLNSSYVSKYGIKNYNLSYCVSSLKSVSGILGYIQKIGKDSTDYDIPEMMENMTISNVSGTNLIKVEIKDVPDEDIAFFSGYINYTVDVINDTIRESTKKPVENAIEYVNGQISQIQSGTESDVFKSQGELTLLNNWQSELLDLKNIDSSSQEALSFIDDSTVVREKGTSKLKVIICSFVLGGMIGVALALVIDFSDKRIYKTLYFRERENLNAHLLSSVPLYKSEERININEYKYIANKLDPDTKSLVVSSISPKAGKTLIANGIAKYLPGTKVIDGFSILKDTNAISEIKNSDVVLIVLRSGIDTTNTLDRLVEDFKQLGIKDYWFVFNGVDISDEGTVKYSNSDDYSHHYWLTTTWRRYYRKHYLA